ncbi:MAG: hypothetical protein GKS07_07720 [Nitrosopumilus sp.]|nr:MAG: hypothetical protein GKS07_07720 [Nitrosopumilus sp.]
MMSLDDRFFSRGGFSSSCLDYTGVSNDADMMDDLCQNDATCNKLIASQAKSRRGHKKSKCGFST